MSTPHNSPQPTNSLLKFLVDISKDDALYAAFQESPIQTMRKKGLSEDEQQLLQSGNEQKIIEYLQNQESDSIRIMGQMIDARILKIIKQNQHTEQKQEMKEKKKG